MAIEFYFFNVRHPKKEIFWNENVGYWTTIQTYSVCSKHVDFLTGITSRKSLPESFLGIPLTGNCYNTLDNIFFLTQFLCPVIYSIMYPENPEGTQVIVGSMNMGYISDTGRNQTHNLFRPKCAPIPLGHSDGHHFSNLDWLNSISYKWFLW